MPAVYNYSRQIKPPAPFLDIQVSAMTESRQTTVLAMIDTGSDGVTVPEFVASSLDLRPVDPAMIQGAVGPAAVVPMFRAFVSIEPFPPEELEVIVWPRPFALLGRKFLNKYHITLDGPNLTFTIAR